LRTLNELLTGVLFAALVGAIAFVFGAVLTTVLKLGGFHLPWS
jgi:hypothetical protein